MSIAKKIFWNTSSQIFAKAILAVIGILTVKVVTSYLGVAGYGHYTAVYEFIAFFGIASDLGLYTIAVREISKNENEAEKIIGNIFTLRTILAISVMLIAFVSAFFYQREDSTILFPLAAAITAMATIFALLTGTVATVLQVNYKMQYSAAASIIGKLAAFSYMLYIIFLWKPENPESGFYQLLTAGIFGNFILFATTYYYARKYSKISYRFDPKFLKDVIVNALPYGLALILNNLYFRIGSLMLYRIDGEFQSGLYGVTLRILESFAIIPLYFMNSVLPILTKTIKEKDEKYQKIIQYAFDFLVMAGVSIAVGVSVISYQIISIISNEDFLSRIPEGFYGSDIALKIVIFALAFSFLNTLFGFILVAVDKQSKLLYINGSGAFLAIILNLILIPRFHSGGAAITDVLVELYVALTAFYFAQKYLHFKLKLTNPLKIIFAGVVMGAVIYSLKDPLANFANLNNKSVLLLIPIGAIVYGALLLSTGVITKEMLALIFKKSKQADEDVRIEP